MPTLKELDELNAKQLAPPKQSLEDLDALNAKALAPAPKEPSGVELVGEDGSRTVVSADEAPIAIAQGYRLASDVAAEQRQAAVKAEHGGLPGMFKTGASEFLDSATLGASSAASAALIAKQASGGPRMTPEALGRAQELVARFEAGDERLTEQQRAIAADFAKNGISGGGPSFAEAYQDARQVQADMREANPITAGAARVAGALAPALATGGTGLGARALAATPAGLLARGSNAVAQGVGKLGTTAVTGALARTAGTALAGTIEGTVASGLGAMADQLPQFAVDPQQAGEHVLAAMYDGGLLGAAIGGGLGGGVEALSGLAKGGKSLLDAVVTRGTAGGMSSGSVLQDFAYDSAAKAVIGRTNKAAVSEINKGLGGTKEFGKSMLDEGIVGLKEGSPIGMDAAEILDKASAAKERWGQRLGDLVQGLDAQPNGPEIARRMRQEVIDPLLKSPSSRADGVALANKYGDLLDELDQNRFGSFDALWNERRVLDQRAKIASKRLDSDAADVVRMRDVLEDEFVNQAEATGGPAFRGDWRQAKLKYKQITFAEKQAKEAVNTQLANRFFSPSDYGMGLAGGVAGGPITGAAMGAANKVARERGRATIAHYLNQFAGQGAQQSALVSITNTGMERLALSARNLVTNVGRAKFGPIGAVAQQLTDQQLAGAVAHARELGDPNSPAAQELAQTGAQLDAVNRGMGQAYVQSMHAVSQLINSKVPQNPSNAVFSPGARFDGLTARSLQRTVVAAMNPRKTFERLASGDHSPEDVETVRKVYPGLYRSFQQQVTAELAKLKNPPDLQTRLRVAYVTGLANVDPSMSSAALRFQQQVANGPDMQKAEEARAQAANQAANDGGFRPGNAKFRDADSVYAAPVDRLLDRR